MWNKNKVNQEVRCAELSIQIHVTRKLGDKRRDAMPLERPRMSGLVFSGLSV
jgi:hypothetical protein